MALVCVVECKRGAFDPAKHNCFDHDHIILPEAIRRVSSGDFEWLKQPASRRDRGIVRILQKQKRPRLYGLSCEVGAELAVALAVDKDLKKEREPWAEIMLADQTRRKTISTPMRPA